MLMIRLVCLAVIASFALGLVTVKDADAHVRKGVRTHVHRSWKGKRICHTFRSHKVRHAFYRHHRHRCWFHSSHQLRVRRGAVRFAMAQRGKPYIWGATGPWGYDCSGLIYAAYRHVGKWVPRTTFGMLAGLRWHGGHLRVGDMLFMHPGHVALFIGHGRVVVARHTGTTITTQPAWMHRWAWRSPRF